MNRRLGDFLAIVEADFESARESPRFFGRLGWSGEDLDLSASALFDLDTEALRGSAELVYTGNDILIPRFFVAWNRFPERWNPPLPTLLSAGLILECFY